MRKMLYLTTLVQRLTKVSCKLRRGTFPFFITTVFTSISELIDQHQMHLIRQRLTSIGQALEALHEDTDNLKLGNLIFL